MNETSPPSSFCFVCVMTWFSWITNVVQNKREQLWTWENTQLKKKTDFHDIYTCHRDWKTSGAAAKQSPVRLVGLTAYITLSSWNKSEQDQLNFHLPVWQLHAHSLNHFFLGQRETELCVTLHGEVWACIVQNFQHFSADLHAAQHICVLSKGRSTFQGLVVCLLYRERRPGRYNPAYLFWLNLI